MPLLTPTNFFGNITKYVGNITKPVGGLMLEKLFGNAVIEKLLFYFLLNEKGYGSELAKRLDTPLYSIQKALIRLEDAGIIVGLQEGKTRIYRFNPRYPFLKELKAFLEKAYAFLPKELKTKFYEAPIRRRPRRTGKPLKRLTDD